MFQSTEYYTSTQSKLSPFLSMYDLLSNSNPGLAHYLFVFPGLRAIHIYVIRKFWLFPSWNMNGMKRYIKKRVATGRKHTKFVGAFLPFFSLPDSRAGDERCSRIRFFYCRFL
ncbi:hypothetical protein CEXT_321201 [Caerostris extrusa]|uniref:Uncharacterized protein n=1 Tax=Caerostris extrusa TaxID=172846 RepID=A0AAV4T9W7_CAEEX|nr:hypothetical protein CEXT_321201 [Caerostris extrusa]